MTNPITKQLEEFIEEIIDDWCDETGLLRIGKYGHDEFREYLLSKLTNFQLDLLKTIESEVEKRKAQCFKCKSTELSRGMDGKAICEKCLSDNQWNNITVSLNEELDQVIALLKEE